MPYQEWTDVCLQLSWESHNNSPHWYQPDPGLIHLPVTDILCKAKSSEKKQHGKAERCEHTWNKVVDLKSDLIIGGLRLLMQRKKIDWDVHEFSWGSASISVMMKSWQEWPPFLSYMCPITFSIPLQSDSENCTHSFLSYNSVWNFCWRNEHLKVEGGKWKFLCFICYVTASSPLWAIVTILAGETTFKRDTLGSHICLLEYWKNSPQRTKKSPKSHAGGRERIQVWCQWETELLLLMKRFHTVLTT